jgi:hypothetical protein
MAENKRIRVDFGERSVIKAILIEFPADGGPVELGVNVLVPTSIPGDPRPYLKELGCSIKVTEEQRGALVALLQGRTPNGQSETEQGDHGGKGETPLPPDSDDSRRS